MAYSGNGGAGRLVAQPHEQRRPAAARPVDSRYRVEAFFIGFRFQVSGVSVLKPEH
jgi:hypothetical protein